MIGGITFEVAKELGITGGTYPLPGYPYKGAGGGHGEEGNEEKVKQKEGA